MEQLTKASAWKIESIDGSKIPVLSDFSGESLLMLFFNIGCVTCLGRAIPYALKLKKQFPNLKTLGVHTSFEGREFSAVQIKANVDHLKVDFPVVADLDHQTWSDYEAGGTPHWILINANGEIEKSIFGSMPNALQRLDYSLIEIFENN